MSEQVVHTNSADIIYDPDKSIVVIDYYDNKLITKADAEEIINKSLELVGGKKFGVVSVFKDNPVSKDAQDVLRQSSPGLVAVASIVKNEILKDFINMFAMIRKFDYDFKLFTDVEKAKEWVETKVKESK